MNGSLRVVADTNVYFMFFYNPESKAGKLIGHAIANRIEIFSPDTVKEELKRVLVRELDFGEAQAITFISYLPVRWINREIYEKFMIKAEVVKHKSTRLALALALSCGIITANTKDFKPARKIVKIWEIDELLEALNKAK